MDVFRAICQIMYIFLLPCVTLNPNVFPIILKRVYFNNNDNFPTIVKIFTRENSDCRSLQNSQRLELSRKHFFYMTYKHDLVIWNILCVIILSA